MLNQNNLKDLSTKLKNDIDNYCVQTYNDGPRSHLGASEIGHSCNKYLNLKFRHIDYKVHTGQMYRLLNRGHFEEPRNKALLEGIGFIVTEFDEANIHEEDKGKRQIRISDCKGHFGGSVDGIAYREDVGKVLVEYKTTGVGKKGDKFDKLVKEGVKINKPQHWAQMAVYSYKLSLNLAIYMAVNKNTDELHIEVIEPDLKLGSDLIRKASVIIFATEPLQGVACNASYFQCQWCDFKDTCYSNKPALVNCRSCKMCEPVEDAQWFCHKWNSIVPKEYISNACSEWISFI